MYGTPLTLLGYIHFLFTRTIALLALLGFIVEKIFKFKIKPNIITDNLVYKTFFTLGLLGFIVYTSYVLYLVLYYYIYSFSNGLLWFYLEGGRLE